MLRYAVAIISLCTPAMADVPRVAVDIPPLHSLVAQVMEGVGMPELVLPPGLSPHDVALRPSDARALAGADLVVWIGPELSPAIARAVDALAVGEVLTLLDVPGSAVLEFREGAVFGGGEHDHDHDHGARDPHGWLDPVNAALWVHAIAAVLGEIDPTNSGAYEENAEAASARINAQRLEIEARLTPLRVQPFVVFHDAYHYFEARFEVEAAGAISLGDGAAPGPRRLAEITNAIEELGVRCVFAEPQFNAGLVDITVANAGARIGVIDPLGVRLELGVGLYDALLDAMATSFEECLAPE